MFLPALLTKVSTLPYLLSTSPNAFSIDASSSMSICIGMTSDLDSKTSALSLEIEFSAFSRERLPIRMVCGCGEAYKALTLS